MKLAVYGIRYRHDGKSEKKKIVFFDFPDRILFDWLNLQGNNVKYQVVIVQEIQGKGNHLNRILFPSFLF